MARNRNRNRNRNRPQQPQQQGGGNKFYEQALQELMVELQPYLNQLQRAQRQGRNDFRDSMARYGQVYNAYGNDLSNVANQYSSMTAGINPQLISDIGSLSGMLGNEYGMANAAENTAGRGVVGTIGAGALQTNASNTARNAAYGASALRQGAMEEKTAKVNARSDWTDYKRDLNEQRLQALEGLPGQASVLARNLRNDAFNRRMQLAANDRANRALELQAQQIANAEAAAAAESKYYRRLINLIKGLQNPSLEAYITGNYGGGGPPWPGGGAYEGYDQPWWSGAVGTTGTANVGTQTGVGVNIPWPGGGTGTTPSGNNNTLSNILEWLYPMFRQYTYGAGR